MAIREFTISSMTNYIQVIEDLTNQNDLVWFRGHETSDYKLSPSIYRLPFKSQYEENFYIKFRSRALPYIKNITQPNDYFSWLFLMQHHGVPTRLLDWSSSSLIALAFAILYRDKKYNNDAIVWCLNPLKLNEEDKIRVSLSLSEKIPDITMTRSAHSAYKFKPDALVDYPIAITGPLNNDRIVSQKGTFTLFPDKDTFNLEDTPKAEEFLTKLIIPPSHIVHIYKQLIILGITESSIFPELSSLGLEIKRELINSITT